LTVAVPALKPLGPAFYRKPVLDLAKALLGKLLIHEVSGEPVGGFIVEVEAYCGEDDPASHAFVGKTARNAVMYGAPGHAYVYFTYGMHYCVNVVTGRKGEPHAILVRALEPSVGIARMRRLRGEGVPDRNLARGPARLCQALALSRPHNGLTLAGPELFVARGRPAPAILGVSARVGIRKGLDRPWRFFDAESPYVSPGRPGPPGRVSRSEERRKRRAVLLRRMEARRG